MQLNKWESSTLELVLTQNSRGAYQIDINDKLGGETRYCYEFKDREEAESFFESQWKHIFLA